MCNEQTNKTAVTATSQSINLANNSSSRQQLINPDSTTRQSIGTMPWIHNLQKIFRKERNKSKRGRNLQSDNSIVERQLTNTVKIKETKEAKEGNHCLQKLKWNKSKRGRNLQWLKYTHLWVQINQLQSLTISPRTTVLHQITGLPKGLPHQKNY